MNIQDSRLVSFFVYSPELSKKEGTEHLKILFYHPSDVTENRKVRNIGLCEALVNFTKTFNPSRPCEAVHTQKQRQVFHEPEPNIWMVMTVSVPCGEVINNGEKSTEYYDSTVQDSVLDAALVKAYCTFKLFNGLFGNIMRQFGVEGLKSRMEKFFTRYIQTMNVSRWDIFDVFQGIQFLPLEKYIYLKIHCFINQVETAFRCFFSKIFPKVLRGDMANTVSLVLFCVVVVAALAVCMAERRRDLTLSAEIRAAQKGREAAKKDERETDPDATYLYSMEERTKKLKDLEENFDAHFGHLPEEQQEQMRARAQTARERLHREMNREF